MPTLHTVRWNQRVRMRRLEGARRVACLESASCAGNVRSVSHQRMWSRGHSDARGAAGRCNVRAVLVALLRERLADGIRDEGIPCLVVVGRRGKGKVAV